MQISKIHSDNDFAQVYPDFINISIKSPEQRVFLAANRNESSFGCSWVELEGIIENKSKPIPDLSRLSGADLVLSARAYMALKETLETYGEFYKIPFKGESYYLFRCLNIINKVDEEKSQLDDEDEIVELHFRNKDVDSQLIWSTQYGYGGGLFCSQKFAEILDQMQLTGLRLNQNLASS